MKRTFALASSATLVFALAACGGDTGTETPADDSPAAGEATPDDGQDTADDSDTTDDAADATDGDPAGSVELPDLSGEELEVAAVWTGTEEERFALVLEAFEEQTGASIQYTSTGDDIAPVLTPRVEGGNPPDVAMLPQPGLLNLFAGQGALQPVSEEVEAAIDEHYDTVWKDLGTVEGDLYGVWFKAANKSTIWYDVEAVEAAGVSEPTTWEDLVAASQTISDSGVTPWSIAGADGWTLTDWFENVYLAQAGPDMYDQLTNHEIPWTDPSVEEALTTLAEIWGQDGFVAEGALQNDFPTSVTTVFSSGAGSRGSLRFTALARISRRSVCWSSGGVDRFESCSISRFIRETECAMVSMASSTNFGFWRKRSAFFTTSDCWAIRLLRSCIRKAESRL